jgi:hypothetical protein
VAEGLARAHKGDHSKACAHGEVVGDVVTAETQLDAADQSTVYE